MNFVFLSPNYPEHYYRFCSNLANNGVTVLGIGDTPYDNLKQELKDCLTEYYKVNSLENYDELVKAMGYFTFHYGKIDYIESNNEYWLETDAKLRTDFNITTGFKNDEIAKIKYKSEMKKYYAEVGIKTARYTMVTDFDTDINFVNSVNWPVIVKPNNGVGAIATYRLNNVEEMKHFYETKAPVPYIMEEYVPGYVVTFDGVCDSNSKAVFAASHLCPDSIMEMVNSHIPCVYYVEKEIASDVREYGEKTLAAFAPKKRCFHLEFFRLTQDKEGLGKKGDLIGLEVNMRNAGGFTPDMINYSQSADMYQIWADTIVYDKPIHHYEGNHYYCCFVGRFDDKDYANSYENITTTYKDNILLSNISHDAMSTTMGNEMYIIKTNTKEEMHDFITYVTK